jgi:serine/threonine protein kinase
MDGPICQSCETPLPFGSKYCNACGNPVPVPETNPFRANIPTDLRQALQMATAGEYEIHHELGRGGMGSVFLAREIGLDRLVAIKVLPPSLMFDEGLITRFKREARMVAKLHHPNIIPVYRVHHAANLAFYTMHFVPGRSVSELISSKRALAVPEIERIMLESAAGLGYAHKRGVIHRDVKPANILLDAEGHAHLTDFGIAKALVGNTQLTETGALIGTPQYMAPEQCEGRAVDGRSDQYSLAVVGYQLITGRPPFESDSMKELLYHHLFTPPRPLSATHSEMSPNLQDAIHKALSKDPADRFDTMEDFARAVEGKGPPVFVRWLEDPVERRHTPAPAAGPGAASADVGSGTTERFLEAPWAALDSMDTTSRASAYRRAIGALVVTAVITAAVVALALSRDAGVARPFEGGEPVPTAGSGSLTAPSPPSGSLNLEDVADEKSGEADVAETATDRTAVGSGEAESEEMGEEKTPSDRPSPAGTPQAGTLVLTGELPANIRLTIDGESLDWPRPGGRDVELAPGEHRVEVSAAGFEPFSANVRVEPAAESTLRVNLERVSREPARTAPTPPARAAVPAAMLADLERTMKQGDFLLTELNKPADALSLYREVQKSATSGIERYRDTGRLKMFGLRALVSEGDALRELGRYVEAAASYQDAESLAETYLGTPRSQEGLSEASLVQLRDRAGEGIVAARRACTIEKQPRCP